jgi:hypothetical protein
MSSNAAFYRPKPTNPHTFNTISKRKSPPLHSTRSLTIRARPTSRRPTSVYEAPHLFRIPSLQGIPKPNWREKTLPPIPLPPKGVRHIIELLEKVDKEVEEAIERVKEDIRGVKDTLKLIKEGGVKKKE